MSGVFAVFNRDDQPSPIDLIDRIVERLRHRGTHPSQVRSLGAVTLGLSPFPTTVHATQDLQPQTLNDATVVADARLDNRRELLSDLGLDDASTSDTTVILHAYQRWGARGFAKLMGDFAFCLWDGRKRTLFLARDAASVRPLFYAEVGARFLCASEMFALFAEGRLPKRPNLPQLALYIVDEYLERDQTLYEHVRSVPGGHYLEVTADRIALHRHWDPANIADIRHPKREEYPRHYRAILEEAVRVRVLDATSRLTVHLSGGIDSSSVTAMVRRLIDRGAPIPNPLFLHARFPGLPCDEYEYAHAVAERWNVELFQLFPAPPDAYPLVADRLFPDQLCAPGSDSSNWEYRHIIAQGSRIALTGFGTDEILHHMGSEVVEALRCLRGRDLLIATGLRDHPLSRMAWRHLFQRGVLEGLRRALPRPLLQLYRRRYRGTFRDRGMFLTDTARSMLASRRARLALEKHPERFRTLAQCEAAFSITHNYDLSFFMNFLDREAAQHPVELRHPFLDRRLLEYVLAIPDEERSGGTREKTLVRNAMRNDLPAPVLRRSRRADYSSWFLHVLFDEQKRETMQLLNKSRLAALGVVDGRALTRVVASRDTVRDISNIITLELWLRRTE